MWLVDRDSDGLSGERIALPSPLRTALVRWYIGIGDRGDEEAGILLVQQARVGCKWIGCDCLGDDAPPPILTPAFLSEAETFYLRRLTGASRPVHRLDCPFFRDQATNRLSEVGHPQSASVPAPGYFEVLRPAPEKLAQAPDHAATDDRTRQGSVPRLARLLWRLLDLAGCHRFGSEPGSITHEFSSLWRVSGKIEVAPGIGLDQVMWTHGQALHSRRAYATLRALSGRWPRGHAAQGFLFLFATEFKGHEVFAAGAEPIRIANRVQSPSLRNTPVKGPYLVIVVIGEYPERRGFVPLRAYAQPILSGHRFVPVESEQERSVLHRLLAYQRLLLRRRVQLLLERPIFDRLTPLGACRPDIWLEARSLATGEVFEAGVDCSAIYPNAARNADRQKQLEQFGRVIPVGADDVEGSGLVIALDEIVRLL